MTGEEQIFLKDINETGFYCAVDDTERLYIYEVINNVSQEWIKKDPKAKLIFDLWIYDYTDYDDRKVYGTSGNLEATYCDMSTSKVYKIEDTKFKIFGNCGQFLMEDKPTYKEQLSCKTAEYEKMAKGYEELTEIVSPYMDDFTGYNELGGGFDIVLCVKELLQRLACETQECDRMKHYLYKIREDELSSLDIDYDEYLAGYRNTDYSNIITYVEYALGEKEDD